MVGCSVVLKGQTIFVCVCVFLVSHHSQFVYAYTMVWMLLLLQNASTLSVELSHTKKYSGWLCFYHFG